MFPIPTSRQNGLSGCDVNVVLPMLKYPRTTVQLGSVALLAILTLTFSYIQAVVQISYAAQQEVRTLRINIQLDKIQFRREYPSIRFQVVDEKASAASSTANYPDGTTVSQFSAPNDSSGDASVTWKIEPDPPLGPYSLHKIIEKLTNVLKYYLLR